MTLQHNDLQVLILGGMTHLARALIPFLVNHDGRPAGGPRLAHLRIVDKYLVDGDASSTYVDPQTLQALKDPRVEYRQANLNVVDTARTVLVPPNGSAYDFVFDLTGEGIVSTEVPAQLLLERTTKLAGSLASLAAQSGVKAYVRDTPPFHTSKAGEKPASEVREGGTPYKTRRAYWWYEAERAAASVEDLNLVILRSAGVYGPYMYHGEIMPRFTMGELYRDMKEPLKLLWGPDLRTHTIHTRDWCRFAWASALWMAERGRKAANAQAGELLPPCKLKNAKDHDNVDAEADHPACCPRAKTPTAPVFNVVDDQDTDQGKLLAVIGKVFQIETGFTNAAINAYARLNLSSVVDDINEKHTAAAESYRERNPSIAPSSPLTGVLSSEELAQRAICLDGAKARRVLGWSSSEVLDEQTLKEINRLFSESRVWASTAS